MADVTDFRDLDATGWEIPSENYCDQPYVLKTDDGAWLCQMTTGHSREGQPGEHVVSMRSEDRGRTWSNPVALEPADGPEAAYAVLLKASSGRIFCFYNHNTDNIREVVADDPPFKGGKFSRLDSLGHFVFKYTDDHGRTWSDKRYEIPIRETEVDRNNPYQGNIRFFWNVGKAFVHEGAACVPLHKIGRYGHGGFLHSEGVVLRSENLLTEPDPGNAAWETLPEGEIGLRAPEGGGIVAEEQSFVVLDDGSIYVVYRTTDGHPAASYSRDGGRTWEAPYYETYATGERIRHPRAACFAWKCENGKYLLWHHNNRCQWYNQGDEGAGSRNVAWLSGGIEKDGRILWSEPDIVLYSPNAARGPSYPDLIEDGGNYYITETQKSVAKTHWIDSSLLEGLWGQLEACRGAGGPASRPGNLPGYPSGGASGRAGCPAYGEESTGGARKGPVLDLSGGNMPSTVEMPELPLLADIVGHEIVNKYSGFTIALSVRFAVFTEGDALLDARNDEDEGLYITVHADGTLGFSMSDIRLFASWRSDKGRLEAGRQHHVVVIVDGGPKVIAFVIDGILCKGGNRKFGWGRFRPDFRNPNGDEQLRIGGDGVTIEALRIYDRALRVSEAIAAFRS